MHARHANAIKLNGDAANLVGPFASIDVLFSQFTIDVSLSG